MGPEDRLQFKSKEIEARFVDPAGKAVVKRIEIRTNPITRRSCRITYSRKDEKEAGTDTLPPPPPDALDSENCPFCRHHVLSRTPRLPANGFSQERLVLNESILFPNLFPYGSHSAVSIFGDRHYVEIGTARPSSYRDSFKNAVRYLQQVRGIDPAAVYTSITQNHLPSAGGSLVHPHLQINADREPGNHQRFLMHKSRQYYNDHRVLIFSDYLRHEKAAGSRYIGKSGGWEWLAAFAPEGFYELWAILPGVTSWAELDDGRLMHLATGIVNAQRFYRSLNRNGYNLGLLSVEVPESRLELRVVMVVRSNYAPWVRNDHTGFELMLGDMATFTPPEETAALARPFWNASTRLAISPHEETLMARRE
ncbi:MAG: galactose-1-phosphate uridylyltransferase [Deltaproteobacteria bacterium]|nr:galactose-1-phosphate uridylyltransferase [Deltaproteobacteria bacterium]